LSDGVFNRKDLINELVSALGSSTSDVDTMLWIMKGIRILSRLDCVCLLLSEVDAIDIMHTIMTQYRSLPEVQEWAAATMWNLAYTYNGIRQQIGSKGIIPLIIDAMTLYPQNASLQEQSCGALWNFSVYEENTAIIGENGMDVIIASLVNHPDYIPLVENAAGALRSLATIPSNASRLGNKNDGIKVLLAAMKRHTKVTTIQEQVAAVLWNLTSHNEENDLRVSEQGGIETLVHALKLQMNHENVVGQICGALYNLSFFEQTKQVIIQNGGIRLINQVLEHYKSNEAITTNFKNLLAKLS